MLWQSPTISDIFEHLWSFHCSSAVILSSKSCMFAGFVNYTLLLWCFHNKKINKVRFLLKPHLFFVTFLLLPTKSEKNWTNLNKYRFLQFFQSWKNKTYGKKRHRRTFHMKNWFWISRLIYFTGYTTETVRNSLTIIKNLNRNYNKFQNVQVLSHG